MAEVRDDDRISSNGRGAPELSPAASALAGVAEAIQHARHESEALTNDFQQVVDAAARSAERVGELEADLSEAVRERDEARARARDAAGRAEVAELVVQRTEERVAAEYEARFLEARDELRRQATAKLRARAARIDAEAEASIEQARRDQQADRREHELKLAGEARERESEVAGRERETEARIEAGIRAATEATRTERAARHKAERRLTETEERLATLADWLAAEAEAKVRRESAAALADTTTKLEAEAEERAKREHDASLRRAEGELRKRLAADRRLVREGAEARAEAARERVEADVEEAVARIRRELLG